MVCLQTFRLIDFGLGLVEVREVALHGAATFDPYHLLPSQTVCIDLGWEGQKPNADSPYTVTPNYSGCVTEFSVGPQPCDAVMRQVTAKKYRNELADVRHDD